MVLPLLVMPFLALGFYAAGGGKGPHGSEVAVARGINAELPDANFKTEDPSDKMGFYAEGQKDTSERNGIADVAQKMGFSGKHADEKTEEINAKLAALNREINAPPVYPGKVDGGSAYGTAPKTTENGGGMREDIDRLELLMKSMKEDKTRDPEMEQMDQLLEKILLVQDPSRAATAPVGAKRDSVSAEKEFLAVPAELVDGGKVISGATVRLRLLDTVVLKNVVIPKGHEVFGLCRVTNQRLLLNIKNIRLGNSIVPVDLTMYGLDGMAGISAPDAVLGNAAGSGAVDAVNGVSVYGMDGIGGQVAGAGIDAAKSLFSKKVKVVKVKLAAGQKVLLRINGR